MKCTPTGALAWSMPFDNSTGGTSVRDLEVDGMSNLYIMGDFGPSITIDTIILMSPSGPRGGNMFVAKLNPQGRVQ